MSRFADKIRKGEKVSEADWNAYLLAAHQNAPSMTPAAFASYRTADGRTSYEYLAASIESLRGTSATVLDLACGDGYLIPFLLSVLGPSGKVVGIDMSEAELAIARKQHARHDRVRLLSGTAQSLPLEAQSVDAIVCHMALMLMLPLEPVVTEIGRVLKSGGSFSAVIGNSRGKGGTLGEIQSFTNRFLSSRYPKISDAATGDARVQNESGIRELFSGVKGFEDTLSISDFALSIETDAQGVWDFMKDMYLVSMLPAAEKHEYESGLKTFAVSKADSAGAVRFEFHMRMFTAKKR